MRAWYGAREQRDIAYNKTRCCRVNFVFVYNIFYRRASVWPSGCICRVRARAKVYCIQTLYTRYPVNARLVIYVVYHYSRAKRASAEVVYNVYQSCATLGCIGFKYECFVKSSLFCFTSQAHYANYGFERNLMKPGTRARTVLLVLIWHTFVQPLGRLRRASKGILHTRFN